MSFINKMERKMYGWRLQPFFRYIIFSMAGVYLLPNLVPQYPLIAQMMFVRDLILRGQVWRLVTFLLIPPSLGGIIQTALMLYFYYFIGTALEGRWGARRFLLYYLVGALAAIIFKPGDKS